MDVNTQRAFQGEILFAILGDSPGKGHEVLSAMFHAAGKNSVWVEGLLKQYQRDVVNFGQPSINPLPNQYPRFFHVKIRLATLLGFMIKKMLR